MCVFHGVSAEVIWKHNRACSFCPECVRTFSRHNDRQYGWMCTMTAHTDRIHQHVRMCVDLIWFSNMIFSLFVDFIISGCLCEDFFSFVIHSLTEKNSYTT